MPDDCVLDDSWFSSWTLPGCQEPDSVATNIIKGTILEPYVEDAKNGVGDSIKAMLTFWIDIPDPDVGTVDGSQADAITFVQSNLAWFAAIVMCFAIAYQCIRIIMTQNAKGIHAVFAALVAYFTVVLIAVPATVAGLLITSALAQKVLEESTVGTNFADNLFSLFSNEVGFTSSILLLGLLIIGMLIACFQCILMIGRGGATFIILGTLSTTAAASATEPGKEALKTQVGWLVALVLYKLVAAIIYGVGFRFLGTDTNAANSGLLQILYGICLLLMAVFALPALLRLTAPSTAPAADGRGPGGVAMGAAPGLAAATMGRR